MLKDAKVSFLNIKSIFKNHETWTKTKNKLKVDFNNQSFYVSLDKDNKINNIQNWFNPPMDAFKTKEEYIEATSIDAKTYFAVQEIVELFLTLSEEGVGE